MSAVRFMLIILLGFIAAAEWMRHSGCSQSGTILPYLVIAACVLLSMIIGDMGSRP